jgi:prolyl oligopeptidase PreP (S9A serine peptidase family)
LRRFADAQFATDRHRLKGIFDRPDNILTPIDVVGRFSTFGRTMPIHAACGEQRRLESFRTETPAWEVLLDLDALAAQEGEDWVWQGGATLPPAHERAIVYLSRGGSDAVVLREFDLSSRKFVPDGFNLPESRSDIVWLDRDTLLLSSSLGAGMATRSGLARTVRLWRRGTDPLTAPVIFEAREDSMVAVVEVDRDAPQERAWFIESRAIFTQPLVGRPERTQIAHRRSERCVVCSGSGLARAETTDHLDGWRKDLCARHRRRDFACGISRRRPQLHDAVPAQRSARAARPLLVRRTAHSIDSR